MQQKVQTRRNSQKRSGGAVVLSSPWVTLASQCACRFCLAAVLATGRVLGSAAPFALGLIASSGAGAGGFFALMGAAVGFLLSMSLADAFRYVATAILVYAVSFAFFDLGIYSKPWFMPLCATAVSTLTGFVYLAEAGWSPVPIICYISEQALVLLFARVYAICLQGERDRSQLHASELLALGSLAVALSGVSMPYNVTLGAILSAAFILWSGRGKQWVTGAAAGLCLGISLDLALGGGAVYTAAFGLGGLLTAGGARWGRHVGVLAFLAGVLSVTLWSWNSARTLSPAWSGILGCCLYLLLPNRWLERLDRLFPPEQELAPLPVAAAVPASGPSLEVVQQRLNRQSSAFRTLFEQLSGELKEQREPPLEPLPLFQRASEQVCRGCSFRSACWKRDPAATAEMLSKPSQALLRQGKVAPGDFPVVLTARCSRINELVNAVNRVYAGEITRRRYRLRLREGRKNLCAQYDQMSRVLSESARSMEPEAVPAMHTPRYCATAGVAAGKRSGQSVSGDAGGWFRDDGGTLWVVLCDGMGSGPEAAKDSRFAYHTLENMISAGITPEVALSTVAGAMGVRWETTGSFTTIDLFELNLNTGDAAVYKLGAAPTYLRRDGSLRCITCSTLPAGLSRDAAPEVSRFRLKAGDMAVLVSDGVTDGTEDGWVRERIAAFSGDSPKDLAADLLQHQRPVADDRTAIVLLLREQASKAV